VATEQYRSEPHDRRAGLLYLGRLVDTKDLPLLVAAYSELWKRGLREPLRIAGGGTLARVLDVAMASLPADARGKVEVLGTVSEEHKRDLLANSLALIVSSKREGFPVVVAEAMASGLPVATVVRPDNGTAAVVRHYGIGASGPPTPSGLADAVESVIADWETCSARGLSQVGELHWERVVDRFLAQVANAIPRQDGTPRRRRRDRWARS
jgi:glycosyltransferase involved in cell wall biosynthesis